MFRRKQLRVVQNISASGSGARPQDLQKWSEGEASSTDVILAPTSQQVMVEESRRRTKAFRSSATPPGGLARNSTSRAATKIHVPESFAAFTTKYRDVLGDADVEEAEAVYSMVALTQAKAVDWSRSKQAAVVAAELPDGRPAKRQQVAAAPACSEGGSSDSNAKSAPFPAPVHPGATAPGANVYPGMAQGFTGTNNMHQQPAGDAAAAVANHMLGSCSMPMAPGFFPGMGLMGMPGASGMAGCPMPPFMPPWAVPPLMFPGMFGSMGMFGAVPPGTPPLMSMSGPGMLPGMLAIPPAVMSGSCMGGSTAHGEPATGFPVSGPVPGAGIGAAGPGRASAAAAAGTAPPVGVACRTVAGKTGQQKQQLQPQPVPAKQVQQLVKVEGTVGSPNSSVTAAVAGVGRGAATEQHVAAVANATGTKAAAESPAVSTGGIYQELEQLDLAAMKHWVLSHFCEDVYLLLLDVWRPDSPSVRDAVWAWKLHISSLKPGCSQPDYRAFLVSLFGLEKLLQLTAAAEAGRATSSVPCPVPLVPRAVAGRNEAGSGDSGCDNVALVVAGRRMLSGLAPAASGTVVGSATSPHVLGLIVQPQPQPA